MNPNQHFFPCVFVLPCIAMICVGVGLPSTSSLFSLPLCDAVGEHDASGIARFPGRERGYSSVVYNTRVHTYQLCLSPKKNLFKLAWSRRLCDDALGAALAYPGRDVPSFVCLDRFLWCQS